MYDCFVDGTILLTFWYASKGVADLTIYRKHEMQSVGFNFGFSSILIEVLFLRLQTEHNFTVSRLQNQDKEHKIQKNYMFVKFCVV